MNTVDFLNTVMPATGERCIALPKGKAFFHAWGATSEWMAQVATHADTTRQVDVFYAPATFKTKDNRKQTNVHAVRSFWTDIDCGPGKPYPMASAGAKAVLEFSAKIGVGRPYLVASGRGVHAYWPTDTDMDYAEWKFVATLLKAAMEAEGVHQDKSRTSDAASVLRVPGTHHRKAEPKLVKVAVEGEITPLDDFKTAMIPYAHLVDHKGDDDLPEGGPAAVFANTNDDLTGGVISSEPSDAEKIADRCGILRVMRDTRGKLDQPTWYYSLGVLAHTQQGAPICHAWSKGDSRYDPAEVDKKLAQLSGLGPTTCAKLGEHHPTVCAACPEKGTITSPIQLGRGGDAILVEEIVRDEATGTLKTVKTQKTCEVEGFKWHASGARTYMSHPVAAVEGDKTVWSDEEFCDTIVHPVSRLWIDGVAFVECEMTMKKGGMRRFLLEGGTMAKGKDTLAVELGRNEIAVKPGKEKIMDGYMRSWLTHLRDTAEQIVAHRSFGWTPENSFVLGDTVLHPGGGSTRAVLVSAAKSKMKALTPTGNLDTWVHVIDRAYNAPGEEAYQFQVVCGFAAPLLSMFRQEGGVTAYAHSDGSGAGKTTVQRAALSIWGNWDKMQLADNKATVNALWTLIGTYHSLPVIYDELTNQKPEVASDLVFSVSSGRGKERMRADGELRETSNWCTIMLASGNTLLSEKLASHRQNSEAERSRLFEFSMDKPTRLDPNEALALFPKLQENYGHAGLEFMRYVVDHHDEVTQMLFATREKVNRYYQMTGVERYWSSLFATVLVSMAICRSLGLLNFPVANMRQWLGAQLALNRGQLTVAATTASDSFGQMLTDLWPGILVTQGEGNLVSANPAQLLERPRGTMTGRAIVPVDPVREVPVLILSERAVKGWCLKNGVSVSSIFHDGITKGWCDKTTIKYSLGKGTIEYSQVTAPATCWKVYPAKISGSFGSLPIAQKMSVIQGGATDVGAGAG